LEVEKKSTTPYSSKKELVKGPEKLKDTLSLPISPFSPSATPDLNENQRRIEK
jgi:hypothetical protein